jgi:hypothetical protein
MTEKNLIELEQLMRVLAKTVTEVLPETGFALLTFDLNKAEGIGNYISNGERGDMIKALRELAERLENNETIPACEGQG